MEEKRGLSGAALKWIAMGLMLLDHTGIALLQDTAVYVPIRLLGRIAFPIFIFFVTEGFAKTHNRGKYLLRMVIFAAISEIPFDYVMRLGERDLKAGRLVEFSYQNVFFTLTLGLCALIVFDFFEKRAKNKWLKILALVLTAAAFGAAGYFLKVDYKAAGPVAILACYFFRRLPQIVFGDPEDDSRQLACAGTCASILCLTCLSSLTELCALPAAALIYFYNGKRGKGPKYLFYAFYPAHLLVLAVLRMVFLRAGML